MRCGVMQASRTQGRFTAILLAALVVGAMLLSAARPGASAPAPAKQPVDLELALGVDVSGSIDEDEARLQREGYIAAFRHPKVLRAIRSGFLRRIAVMYYEWAGFGHARVIADWTVIHDKASALAFARDLMDPEPETASRTAIAGGIDSGIRFIEKNRFDGTRRVVDISGDGPNNWGDPVTRARDRAAVRRITVNGLPIMNDRPSRSGRAPMPDLDLYYRHCVIGGPGAFIVIANDFDDFARAVRRKLVLEIAARQLRTRPRLIRVALRKPPPCDIGERLRRQRIRDWEDETY